MWSLSGLHLSTTLHCQGVKVISAMQGVPDPYVVDLASMPVTLSLPPGVEIIG